MRTITDENLNETIIFESVPDYIDNAVKPALGEYVQDFDIDAIVEAMLDTTTPGAYVERDDLDFWEVAAHHDTTA